MAKTPPIKGLLAGCLLLAGSASAWAQAPAPEQMLKFQPKQKDVALSSPAPEELKGCEVKLWQDKAGGSGWVLLDAKKQPLRRFIASKGAKSSIDVWSYCKDGVEVYREIDSNGNRVPDQYRWLNTAGMKWGVDVNEDGAVDYWQMISAEEVGQEAFQAVATNDFNRLKALFPTARDLDALKLPAAQAERLNTLQKQAPQKFADLTKALASKLAGARFERVEATTPNCVPGSETGSEGDVVKFADRALLYQTADKKHDWLHTGELIQVGLAWRLTDVPTTIDPTPSAGTGGPDVARAGDAKTKELFEKLAQLDDQHKAVAADTSAGLPKLKAYLDTRIALLQQVVAAVDTKERETWYKQIFDNLSTLAQQGDAESQKSLASLRGQVVKGMPGSNLAAYATYRELWTNYALTMGPNARLEPKQIEEFQQKWREQLIEFVKTYDKAEDTPDALYQLAMNTEFAGKDDEAKRWYKQVWSNFPDHYLAARCKGAEARLDLMGKQMKLAGPQLQGGSPYDLEQSKGKVVVVYYWSSIYNQCVADFARLKKAVADNAGKVELVAVNLDDTPELAVNYLKSSPVPGVHLYQAGANGGGLNSPLALQYGIHGPTLFVVGRDGRVLLRAPQVGDIESELKKALQ